MAELKLRPRANRCNRITSTNRVSAALRDNALPQLLARFYLSDLSLILDEDSSGEKEFGLTNFAGRNGDEEAALSRQRGWGLGRLFFRIARISFREIRKGRAIKLPWPKS